MLIPMLLKNKCILQLIFGKRKNVFRVYVGYFTKLLHTVAAYNTYQETEI